MKARFIRTAIGMPAVILLVLGGLWLIDETTSVFPGTPPGHLGAMESYDEPASYYFTATNGSRTFSQAARAPDLLRSDVHAVHVVDGTYSWQVAAPYYWAIPLASKVESGEVTEAPALQDGRPVMYGPNGVPSTRIREDRLGPTDPETLRGAIAGVVKLGGKWSVEDGVFLGREVYVLTTEVGRIRQDGEVRGPSKTTQWIDKQYLFVLAFESSGGDAGNDRLEMTSIEFNTPLPDDLFQFSPPEGMKECLPPQFANRQPGC